MFLRKAKIRKLLNLTRQMLDDYKYLEAENKRLEQENAGLAHRLAIPPARESTATANSVQPRAPSCTDFAVMPVFCSRARQVRSRLQVGRFKGLLPHGNGPLSARLPAFAKLKEQVHSL